jgi:cystathionine gamma-synthase
MAESPEKPGAPGPSTRAVQGAERSASGSGVPSAIHQTSTFWFRDSEEVKAYAEGRRPRDEYGRYSNPTWRAVEQTLCALEGAEAAVLFASGMCAATTTFLALVPRGGHLIATSDCYRRTRQFFRQYLAKLDVEVTVIEPASTIALKDAIREGTTLFFTESPTNPYLRVIDLPEVARVAHERGVRVLVDSTFASPVNHAPLADGADLVLHSATKYLGGHNDLLAGAIAGRAEEIAPIREAAGVLGGVLDPHAAYLLLRGMKTLALRVERQNATALRVARFLEEQRGVRRVWYPGLPSHPDYAVATRLMTGFGGVVTFELETDLAGAMRFTDACRLPYIAPSLGGVESLIEMPVLMSYWDQTPEDRARYGITDTLVRLSCGIEDADDLLADLSQALQAI